MNEFTNQTLDDELDEAVQAGWTCDDDGKADWLVGKYKEAVEDRDRLLTLINQQRRELDRAEAKVNADFEQRTGWITAQIAKYAASVRDKFRWTKTRASASYQLIKGKLTLQAPKAEYKRDDEALIRSLRSSGHKEYIKTAESVAWADLKKGLAYDPESGAVWFADTGEVLDGIAVEMGEEKLVIK